MRAMIFAAGLGTRLRPLTDDRPKALVEIAGKPMLQHVIERLIDCGANELVINIHYFGDKVIQFLENKDNFGITIHISDERQWSDSPLETGGGILKARQWLNKDEPFIVHNADILTDLDLNKFYRFHCEHDHALASLLMKDRNTQRYFLVDANSRLNGWTNISTGEVKPESLNIKSQEMKKLAFGGIHVISPKIFPLLEKFSKGEQTFGITPFYIESCQSNLICGYQPAEKYSWFDIGKPHTLIQAESWLSH